MSIRPSILPSIVLLCFVFPNLANATETLDPMKKLQDRLRAAYEKEAASEGYEARKSNI